MTRKEMADMYHNKGYNCAQSVACTFADQVDMSEEDLFRVMEGFGLGMGGMQGTCGAITGAVAIMSLKNSKGTSDTVNKGKTYKLCKPLLKKFEEKNGATICKEIKGVETGVVLRSCPGCIADAVEILEEALGLN
ncbi:MAG: C-GCAxxG-C-C family protein [Dorea sp.]|nr:C-GCAxxG-C-C family protein [Dorea sp.]